MQEKVQRAIKRGRGLYPLSLSIMQTELALISSCRRSQWVIASKFNKVIHLETHISNYKLTPKLYHINCIISIKSNLEAQQRTVQETAETSKNLFFITEKEKKIHTTGKQTVIVSKKSRKLTPKRWGFEQAKKSARADKIQTLSRRNLPKTP